jgi:hypothetical protein
MAQPAFLQDQQILGQTPETADLSRQRRIAEMLMAGSMEQPQGQMVSGRYVAPSWTQQLAPLAKAAMGTSLSQSLDAKQAKLAEALRGKQAQQIEQYGELEKTDKAAALRFALSTDNPILRDIAKEQLKGIKLGEGEVFTRPSLSGGTTEMKGGAKYRAPIQIDTGTSIEVRDPLDPTKVLQTIPKSRMPTAGQVVETANGPMLVNTLTGAAQPIMGAGGQPIAPKLSSEQSKDITNINQQRAAVNGALQLVEAAPAAFSFGRGLAGKLPAGETLAGRIEKPEETEARSAVFNIVSKVINERAGAAQSAQELTRLNAFLPSELDNAESIKRKLNGFNKYLAEQEKGTRVNPNIPMQTNMPQALRTQQAPQTPKVDPKLLEFMTPEQRKLFGG